MDIKLLKKMRVRRKFRQVIRAALNNRYWLNEGQFQLGEDVRANVTLIYSRRKKDQAGGLTLEDKAIMRKKAEWRTTIEKEVLYNSIGGLKIFRQWPENVKYQLVSSTYFVYYEPGRIIIKQDRQAEALYFVVSGELEILLTYYDEVIEQWVTKPTGKLPQGSMFGEVSLLTKIPYPYTLRTLTHCELLRVDQEDFDETLKETLKEQWDEIKEGLLSFPYFNGLSEIAQTECCTMSKLKEYPPNEIIYSYKAKKYGQAFFILKGSCRIIEKMYIKEGRVGNKPVYSIYKPASEIRVTRQIFKSGPESIRTIGSQKKNFLDARKEEIKKEIYEKCPIVIGLLKKFGCRDTVEEICLERVSQSSKNIPVDVKCHFLEVCTLNEMAVFFENEIFDRRYLVSNTQMKILSIPKYWLYMHNRANIWNRLQMFMKELVPTSEQVFKKFVDDRKWISYKKIITKDALGKKGSYITTMWSDLPYSLRIAEVYKDIE